MADDKIHVAKVQLTGGNAPEWKKDYSELRRDLQNLRSDLQNVKEAYLKKPWKTPTGHTPQPYSLRHEIMKSVDRILTFRLEDFYKENSAGDDLNAKYFDDSRWAIVEAISLAQFLKELPQEKMISAPYATLLQMQSSATELADCLNKMRLIASTPLKDSSKRDEILKGLTAEKKTWEENFYACYREFFDAVLPLRGGLFSAEIPALKEQIQRLTDKNTDKGIQKHSTLYKTQASRHFKAGIFWFVIGLAVMGATIWYANYFIEEIEKVAQNSNIVANGVLLSLVTIRIFIFGLLSTLAFWSFRNYRLNKHNELINKQKELALNTFTEFAAAPGADADTRRIILNKVTSTIFDTQHLGYVDAASQAPDTGSLVSLLENLMPGKK